MQIHLRKKCSYIIKNKLLIRSRLSSLISHFHRWYLISSSTKQAFYIQNGSNVRDSDVSGGLMGPN